MLLIYIPPNLAAAKNATIMQYIAKSSDDLQASKGASFTLICGDLNDYCTTEIEGCLGMVQLVKDNTRKQSLPDKILFYSTASEVYHPLSGTVSEDRTTKQ